MRRGAAFLDAELGPAAVQARQSLAAQEVKEIAVAQQFGVIFIPPMAMEHMQLIESQARARGSPISR